MAVLVKVGGGCPARGAWISTACHSALTQTVPVAQIALGKSMRERVAELEVAHRPRPNPSHSVEMTGAGHEVSASSTGLGGHECKMFLCAVWCLFFTKAERESLRSQLAAAQSEAKQNARGPEDSAWHSEVS